MSISMTIGELCILLITIAGLVMIYYVIKVLKRLVATLEKTNKSLDDANEITETVKGRVYQLNNGIDKLKEMNKLLNLLKNTVKKKSNGAE